MTANLTDSSALILDALIRMSIVLAATWGLARICRDHVAARHAILLAGLTTACLTPLASIALDAAGTRRWTLPIAVFTPADAAESDAAAVVPTPICLDCEPLRPTLPGQETGADPSAAPYGDVPLAAGPLAYSGTIRPGPALAAVWLVVAACHLVGLASSFLALRRTIAAARLVAPLDGSALVRRIQRRVGLRRPPRVYESADVEVPIAAGLVADAIVLPLRCAERLAPAELDAVLCHEAAHLARRDHRVVVFQQIVGSLLWWHPLVRRVSDALTQAREEICDNYALDAIARPDYCRALYRLAAEARDRTLAGATSISSRRWPLEERVRGILDDRRLTVTNTSSLLKASVLASALAGGMLLAMPEVQTHAAAESVTESDASSAEDASDNTDNDSSSAEEASDNSARRLDLGTLTDSRELPDAAREISVETGNADVVFQDAKGDQLDVEARIVLNNVPEETKLPEVRFADHVVVEAHGDTITVKEVPLPSDVQHERQMTISILLPRPLAAKVRTLEGDITIVRAEIDVELTTVNGDVSIRPEVSGKIVVSTADGDVVVETPRIRGAVNAKSADGDVNIETTEVAGPIAVKTNDGDLSLRFGDAEAASIEAVSAKTADGDVNVEFAGPGIKRDLAVIANEGDVRLKVSRQVNAKLAITTKQGEVILDQSIDDPKSLLSGKSKMIAAQLGSGGASFGVLTGEGDVEVEVAE